MGSSIKLELEIIRFETSDIVTVSGPWPLENGSEYVVKGSELHQGGYGYYHQSGPYGGFDIVNSPYRWYSATYNNNKFTEFGFLINSSDSNNYYAWYRTNVGWLTEYKTTSAYQDDTFPTD